MAIVSVCEPSMPNWVKQVHACLAVPLKACFMEFHSGDMK